MDNFKQPTMIQIYYADQHENGSYTYEIIYKQHYVIFDHIYFDKRGKIMDWELIETLDEFDIPVNMNLSDIEIKIMLSAIELNHIKQN